MAQKFLKLLLLVSCVIPVFTFSMDLTDISDFADETNSQEFVKKPFNSLQVAGPLAVTGLTSVNALNVKQGADFGGDVAVDGTLFVDGGIVLDSCLVMTCTSAGQLLVNGVPVGGSSFDSIDVTGDAVIGGSLSLNDGCVLLTCTTAGQLLVNDVPVTPAADFFYAYTTATPSPSEGSAADYAVIQLSNVAPTDNQWTIPGEPFGFQCPTTGVYEIAYTAQVNVPDNGDGGTPTSVFFAINNNNGGNILGSISQYGTSTTDVPQPLTIPEKISHTFLASLSANDVISLQWFEPDLSASAALYSESDNTNNSVSASLMVHRVF